MTIVRVANGDPAATVRGLLREAVGAPGGERLRIAGDEGQVKTDELLKLLREHEGPMLEFKRRWYDIDSSDGVTKAVQRDELIKDVLALANGSASTAGRVGHLIIGASDEVDEEGHRALFDAIAFPAEGMRQRLLQMVSSACNPALEDVSFEVVHMDGKRLGVLTVHPSPHLHETTRELKTPSRSYCEHVVFTRSGETIRIASAEERAAIARLKRLRFKEHRNVPPVAFGAVIGGITGAMAGLSLALQQHQTLVGRVVGMIAGVLVFAGLGAVVGSGYRQVAEVRHDWGRYSRAGQLSLIVFAGAALIWTLFYLTQQVLK